MYTVLQGHGLASFKFCHSLQSMAVVRSAWWVLTEDAFTSVKDERWHSFIDNFRNT